MSSELGWVKQTVEWLKFQLYIIILKAYLADAQVLFLCTLDFQLPTHIVNSSIFSIQGFVKVPDLNQFSSKRKVQRKQNMGSSGKSRSKFPQAKNVDHLLKS